MPAACCLPARPGSVPPTAATITHPHPRARLQARKMILDRGERMGLDFASEIAALYQVDWPAELKMVSSADGLPC